MYDEIELEMALLQPSIEEQKRHLVFSGAKNFRDLGGYQTVDGKPVCWGKLYRSGHLHKLTDSDLQHLVALQLDQIIDFRAEREREVEPDRLPANSEIRIVALPILDSSTKIWRDSQDQSMKDALISIDPAKFMTETNIEMVTNFTPQISQFFRELLSANGRPVLFHCAAGKDRTGYAATILLRTLGVPPEVVLEDYLLSNEYYLSAHSLNLFLLRWLKGKRFFEVVKGFMEVRPAYLAAAFEAIDREFNSFKSTFNLP